jgi:hypothetical protein
MENNAIVTKTREQVGGGGVGQGGDDLDRDGGSLPRLAAAIELDITGKGLMLSGRFEDWESGVMMGPDLDQLQVRLAIDATSVNVGTGRSAELPLFSFRGRNASPVGKGVYQVDGAFTGAAGEHPLQVQLETLAEHSALFLMSFEAKKSDFGPFWTQLLSNVVPFAARAGEPTKPAHAWLKVPELAAA